MASVLQRFEVVLALAVASCGVAPPGEEPPALVEDLRDQPRVRLYAVAGSSLRAFARERVAAA